MGCRTVNITSLYIFITLRNLLLLLPPLPAYLIKETTSGDVGGGVHVWGLSRLLATGWPDAVTLRRGRRGQRGEKTKTSGGTE